MARASAGVNNIPVPDYSARGVVVFNTPGANANAVKELVLTGMLLASRGIFAGMNYVQSLTQIHDDAEMAALLEKERAASPAARSRVARWAWSAWVRLAPSSPTWRWNWA